MVDVELDDLKKEFLDEAREKVEEMQSTPLTPRNPESLDRLAYLAHQLKGAGGSYGYQSISTDAAGVEKAVEELVGAANHDGDAFETAIRNHIANLRSEIEQSASELARA